MTRIIGILLWDVVRGKWTLAHTAVVSALVTFSSVIWISALVLFLI